MNVVSVIGRLTKDPELRQIGSGTDVCNLRLAVDRAGPKQDDGSIGAGFFDVTLWGKTAEVAAKYLEKGREVGISGELRWREWTTDDGQKRQATEINGVRLTLIGGRGDSGGSGDGGFAPVADEDIPF